MAGRIVCDACCGKERDAEDLDRTGWFQLRWDGWRERFYDFCSAACLAAWAQEQDRAGDDPP